uniref:RRM domain-containing protein n=1 Tax=Gossypium raimondii TaxID=29730 RepID=A0A0D2R8U8_GOSRA|nr:hypothetical protein B456_005G040700 [Gossypium raimondii]KJB28294.1 hypothetical protein B456_005G040700 [Gossypium raimondii]
MTVLWSSSSISPPLPSLQPPIPSTITSKCSISNPYIPKTFRLGFPYLTHQPLCCSYSTSQSEPSTSPSTGVFIKGLPQSTAEGRLKKVFSQFGEVKQDGDELQVLLYRGSLFNCFV